MENNNESIGSSSDIRKPDTFDPYRGTQSAYGYFGIGIYFRKNVTK